LSPGALATVADLLAHQDALYAYCKRCNHGARVDLGPIIERHGPNYPVERIVKRLRCMNCFIWDAEIRLVWDGLRGD
jgi:hypothetical protein